jgi:hypothetical protein
MMQWLMKHLPMSRKKLKARAKAAEQRAAQSEAANVELRASVQALELRCKSFSEVARRLDGWQSHLTHVINQIGQTGRLNYVDDHRCQVALMRNPEVRFIEPGDDYGRLPMELEGVQVKPMMLAVKVGIGLPSWTNPEAVAQQIADMVRARVLSAWQHQTALLKVTRC